MLELESAQLPGRLHVGDNLPFMQSLQPDFDLIYLDPPFFTGRHMTLPERAATAGFGGWSDRWDDLEGYLSWLEPRLVEAHRLLSGCGSLVVHLDWHAVHYVKVMLDRIFGFGQLVNEIVWCYSIGAKSPRHFGRKHDTLLWYAKGASWHFAPSEVAIPRKVGTHMKVATDEAGRVYQEKRDRRSGKVYRYYVDEGKTPEDWWVDVETLNREDRERTGYPTQKPEALLARIVRGLSPPGGRVGDFFCGSGTTLVAAERHGRAWVGCDVLPEAVAVAESRLRNLGAGIWRG
ncbi:MAG: DNA-methyltransferase [Candidatus Xenobia bacterium]